MNKEMVFTLLRQIGVIGLTYLVASGVLTQDQASVLTKAALDAAPVLGTLALLIYGLWKKRDAAKVAEADKLPGVTVTVNPNIASSAVVQEAVKETNDIKVVQ